MKLKGINPIEQHVEKLVLGVVAVVLLGVIAMQFVLSPNNVEVGSGRTVPPQNIYVELESEAAGLQSQVNDSEPALPDVGEVDLLNRYQAALPDPQAAGDASLAVALGGSWDPVGDSGAAEGLAPGGPIAGLVVPEPIDPVAVSQWASLDPFAVAQSPALGDLAGAQQPYDVAGVSVQATFDGGSLLGVLTDGVDGKRPIPRKFWRSPGLTILSVEAERQRRLPGGGWETESTGVTGLPSGEALPIAGMSDAPDLTELLRVVRDTREQFGAIIQPGYLPAAAGPAWLPPVESQARAAREATAGEAARIRGRIAQLEEELEEVRTGRPATSRPANTGPTGNRPANRNDPARNTRPSTRDDSDRNARTRERRIERINEQIEGLRTELEELGFEEEEEAVSNRRGSRSDRYAGREVPGADQLVGNSIPVWTHDVGVVPGETYRYRLRVVVNNPLFGREQLLDPDDADQQALAGEPLVHSDWSSWTAPTTVPPRRAYFVTSASDASEFAGGEPRAGVELYEMYYGYYRKATVSLGPGDRAVGRTDLPATLLLVDPAAASRDAIERYNEELAQAADRGDSSAEPLPAGVSRAPASLAIELDAALLDVARSVLTVEGPFGREENPLEVVFRAGDGTVVVRDPAADSGGLYAQLAASARAGETAAPRFAEGEGRGRNNPAGGPRDPRDDPRFDDSRRPVDPDDGP